MVSHLPAPQIAVVYIAYLPYGQSPVEQFLASYEAHPAGVEHKLVVAMKGDGEPPHFQSIRVPDNGFDLGTYLWTARHCKADRYLFLNTSSVILADGWLKKLNTHLCEGVGMVGATGSYGSSNNSYLCNPHVRTNAFMLERDLMLDLDWQEPITTKEQAFSVEHGPKSITRQVRDRGLEALVVGRDGEAYPVEDWQASDTFWVNEQANLLVADNATRRYVEGNDRFRTYLSEFAWSKCTVPS